MQSRDSLVAVPSAADSWAVAVMLQEKPQLAVVSTSSKSLVVLQEAPVPVLLARASSVPLCKTDKLEVIIEDFFQPVIPAIDS